MHQRPMKSGYLRQQGLMGIWSSQYFHLEGTLFLVFPSHRTHTPSSSIDLTDTIADGLWKSGSGYQFSLRSQREILLFETDAYDEGYDWLQHLKQAILLTDHEPYMNISMTDTKIKDEELGILSPTVFELLALYKKTNKQQFILKKKQPKCNYYELAVQDIVVKGEFAFSSSYSKIVQAIRRHIDLFKPQTLHTSTGYSSEWSFRNHKIQCTYDEEILQRRSYTMRIRWAVRDSHLPLKLEIIHVVQDHTQCFVCYLWIIQGNLKIHRKFAKEQILAFANLDEEIRVMDEIPMVESRILGEVQCDNQYFQPCDREGYEDIVDEKHPAFIHREMHIRNKLNPEQSAILTQFQAKLSYLKLNKAALERFLIARNFKIKEAEEMLLNCVKWRKENNINSRRLDDYPVFINEKVQFILGISKWGHPVMYTSAKDSRPWKFGETPEQTEAKYLEFHQALIEETTKLCRGHVDQSIAIIDCFNLERKNFHLGVLRDSFLDVFNYYPERQFKIYVLNTDFLTNVFYNLLKPFLPAKTVEKIVFLRQDFGQIKEALLQDLDLETIPQRYGGGNPLVV